MMTNLKLYTYTKFLDRNSIILYYNSPFILCAFAISLNFTYISLFPLFTIKLICCLAKQ